MQMSFVPQSGFPTSHEDVLRLWSDYLFDPETDTEPDDFSWNEIAFGYSYSLYGTKIMEFKPGKHGAARLRLPGSAFPALGLDPRPNDTAFYTIDFLNGDQMARLIAWLRERKQALFRALPVEPFGCCSSFVACSDARACLYPHDRFYNGCYYRKNLEAGRIFYGKNRNVPASDPRTEDVP